jgi:hypothetical protein
LSSSPSLIHLALGLLLVRLELGNARRLLDEVTPLFGLGRDDESDAALLDDRVGLGAHARAQEERRDVHQADRGLVDQVGAVAIAIEPTGDRDLRIVAVLDRHRSVVVLEGERHFGEAVGTTHLRAVEDDVVHVLAAQMLGGLLAHGPAHRVDDVGLPAAIGADDAGHVVVEANHGSVHKGLEPADLEAFELHLERPFGARRLPAGVPTPNGVAIRPSYHWDGRWATKNARGRGAHQMNSATCSSRRSGLPQWAQRPSAFGPIASGLRWRCARRDGRTLRWPHLARRRAPSVHPRPAQRRHAAWTT